MNPGRIRLHCLVVKVSGGTSFGELLAEQLRFVLKNGQKFWFRRESFNIRERSVWGTAPFY
jgi:hypothetical protein